MTSKGFLVGAAALLATVVPANADGYGSGVRIRPLLKADTNALGRPLAYPVTDSAEVTAFEAVIPPGGETGWHSHPYPGYAYVLAGELTLDIDAKDRKRIVLRAGDAYAELVDIRHNGRNTGRDTVRLVAFFTGVKGKANSVKD